MPNWSLTKRLPTWIALHRRAFESFGGVPQRVVPDNLKPAVLQALMHDPVLGEAYRRMGLHYGFLISPTEPGRPQHKGKVENGVHYVQRNFMAGQEFVDILVANQHLKVWITDVAGTRMHGTTHQAPLKLFNEYERAALLPLPAEPFTLCEVKPVKVHPDCHVTIAGSYYSVPYRYIGQTLEAYLERARGRDLPGHHAGRHACTLHGARPMAHPPGRLSAGQGRISETHARLLPPNRGAHRPVHPQVVETCWTSVRWIACGPSQGHLAARRNRRTPAPGSRVRTRRSTMATCAIGASKTSSTPRWIASRCPKHPPRPSPLTFAFARSATEFFASVPEVVA